MQAAARWARYAGGDLVQACTACRSRGGWSSRQASADDWGTSWACQWPPSMLVDCESAVSRAWRDYEDILVKQETTRRRAMANAGWSRLGFGPRPSVGLFDEYPRPRNPAKRAKRPTFCPVCHCRRVVFAVLRRRWTQARPPNLKHCAVIMDGPPPVAWSLCVQSITSIKL